ncbi:C1 family peptidase [Bacillus safensis]|uniref:C1 family peptidase n=1 Tax=Bacillus TaxID=1386 RepID=UPI00163D2A12|nr:MULTISPECIES: C1 family peptidase [Bacillus]MEC1414923.1 C1 family peptidase [Bacillus safensis]QNH48154.1 C1 family peptidase [Bacillus sp. PAMC28571]QNK46012.1 C1 family peptidase [Bacillus sp. PAMC22265]
MSELKGLGVVPSPLDKRDIPMSAVLPIFTAPEKFEVENITPVRDQKNEGTCVGFACAVGIKEWQEQKERNNFIQLSPRYLYEKSKSEDEFPDDSPRCSPFGDGTSVRVAMDMLKKYGVCEERYWPYVPCEPGSPTSEAEDNAKHYRIKAYASLNSIETMKRSLIVNGPFVVGTSVYENWSEPEVWTTGKIPLPNGRFEGGHAICIVGYDDTAQLLKFKNSWGNEWGDNGFGYLPYQYKDSQADRLFFEAYGATDLINDVDDLVRSREKILEQMNENFKEDVKFDSWENQVIKYH